MIGALSKNPADRLFSYLNARRPIIYIHHFDFQVVDRMIESAGRNGMGGSRACVIEEYSEAGGRVNFTTKSPINPSSPLSLEQFLSRFNTTQLNSDRHNYLLVLKDVHGRIQDSRICALLQTIARRTSEAASGRKSSDGKDNRYRVQVVVVDSQFLVPPEIEKLTTVIEIRPPDSGRIDEIIDEIVTVSKVAFKQDFKPDLRVALMGLSEYEIRQILSLAVENNQLNRDALNLIYEEKRQLIKKSGLLELMDARVEKVGGLEKLQSFIRENKEVFSNPGLAENCGVDAPAGVMIVGMPGCGKSLMAKRVASELDVPLLKLDVGRLMGKYVGESENNLHRAIEVAESAAPCVLWIDEIEKAFAGIGNEGGGGSSMTRMFGIFLTWMQEKKSCIYVVATANDIEKLPPEFMRSGRFDKIFKVDYPNAEERRQILEIHVKRRNKGCIPAGLDLESVARRFDDDFDDEVKHYSGSDIESVVKAAMKSLFVRNIQRFGKESRTKWSSLTTNDLLDVILNTKTSYQTQQAKLDSMRKKIAEYNLSPAS